MRTYLQATLIFGCCFSFTGCISGPSIDERSPEVRGRVIDAQTHQPVQGAVVALHEHPSIAAHTDSSGDFRIRARHNVHLVTFLGMCSSDFPEGKYYRDDLDVAHPLYQTLQIHARQYRDPRWTNTTQLFLQDIVVTPAPK